MTLATINPMRLLNNGLAFVSMLALCLALMPAAHAAGLRDDAPPIEDPLKGLLPPGSAKPSGLQRIEGIAGKHVAVILSDNTSAHLKWSAAASGGPGAADRFFGTLFGGQRMMEEAERIFREVFDPKALTAAITRPMVATARQVSIVPDLATFQEGPFDLAVVLDITFLNTFSDGFIVGGKYETATTIKALFFDKELRVGPVVEASEKMLPTRNEFLFKIGEVRRRVIDQFGQRMAQVLPVAAAAPSASPGAAAARSPNPPPAAAPKASVAERLKALEDLLNQRLISPAEAELKRKQILSEL